MARVFDAVIVGAGPAGCACATWLKQLGFSPVLIDRQETCGGLQLKSAYTNSWVPSSPFTSTGQDIARALHQHMVAAEVELALQTAACRIEKDAHGFIVETRSGSQENIVRAKYIVLAGGVVPRTGGLTASPRVFIGAATGLPDADMAGKKVAILGGGDNAFDAYIFAKAHGAKDVNIFARGGIRAQKKMVRQVDVADIKKGGFHADPRACTVNGEAFDYIVVMYGYEVSASALVGLDVQLKPDGYVETDADCRTSVEGVFAVGEMTGRMHPCCVTSMADGIVAAKALQGMLESETTF